MTVKEILKIYKETGNLIYAHDPIINANTVSVQNPSYSHYPMTHKDAFKPHRYLLETLGINSHPYYEPNTPVRRKYLLESMGIKGDEQYNLSGMIISSRSPNQQIKVYRL